MDQSISVMRHAAQWMLESGKEVTKWWDLKNLHKDFLLEHAKEDEFYVGLIDDKPVVTAVLQIEQNAQDWSKVNTPKEPALYIHWLAVRRDFAGKDLPKAMVDFAEELAKKKKIKFLRADTDAKNPKLRKVYEDLGFNLVGTIDEGYRETAFFQKVVKL